MRHMEFLNLIDLKRLKGGKARLGGEQRTKNTFGSLSL